MTVSRLTIDKVLARLIAAGLRPPAGVSPDAAAEFWLGKLQRYQPRAVEAAFERWIDERDTWPLPKHMLPMVDAAQARLEKRLAPPRAQDAVADSNAALEAVMSRMPGAFLVELYELGHADPDLKRRVVNRLAEWELAGGGSTDEAVAYSRAMMRGPTEAAA
jgi:hypothetical protein